MTNQLDNTFQFTRKFNYHLQLMLVWKTIYLNHITIFSQQSTKISISVSLRTHPQVAKNTTFKTQSVTMKNTVFGDFVRSVSVLEVWDRLVKAVK